MISALVQRLTISGPGLQTRVFSGGAPDEIADRASDAISDASLNEASFLLAIRNAEEADAHLTIRLTVDYA